MSMNGAALARRTGQCGAGVTESETVRDSGAGDDASCVVPANALARSGTDCYMV